jgi:hypothetical protein
MIQKGDYVKSIVKIKCDDKSLEKGTIFKVIRKRDDVLLISTSVGNKKRTMAKNYSYFKKIDNKNKKLKNKLMKKKYKKET